MKHYYTKNAAKIIGHKVEDISVPANRKKMLQPFSEGTVKNSCKQSQYYEF